MQAESAYSVLSEDYRLSFKREIPFHSRKDCDTTSSMGMIVPADVAAHRAGTRILAAAAVLLALAAAPGHAASFQGPLQVKNGFPLSSILDAPYLERAIHEDFLSLALTRSSVDFLESDAGLDFRIDLEATDLTVRYRKTVSRFIEFGIDVPFVSFNGGFLDDGIVAFHRALGIDSGKSREASGRFRFEVDKGGVPVVRGKSGRAGLGDIRVSVKKNLFRSPSFAMAAAGDLEFPSGDAGKGYGSGRLDKRVALLAEGTFGNRFNVVVNVGKVFPGDLHGLTTLRFDDYRYGGLAVEAVLSARSAIVAQIFLQDTPLPGEGLVFPVLLANPRLVSVGYRYLSDRYGFDFSLTENLHPSFSPDLMLNVTMRRNLK